MVFSKHILSAVVAASTAYAQCSGSDPIAVQNQQDVNGIASCPKYTGDININPRSGATLDFGQIGEITGTVSMDADDLVQTLKFGSLKTLGGLKLSNLTSLSALDLSSLKTVKSLDLENLAALSRFNFGTSGLEEVGDVRIENVQISDLSGIASATKINSIILSNNQYLREISFNVKEIDKVDIAPNNFLQGQSIDFPQLVTATSLTFRNSSSVNVPKLKNVAEDLGLYGNTFQSFSATNVSWVGSLILNNNPQVTNFSFPNLVSINGTDSKLTIQNNTDLKMVNGFPKLTEVSTGDATFAGNIENITLPALTDVAGAMIVDTTSQNFDCDGIQGFYNNQTVKGSVDCKKGSSNPVGSDGTSTSGGSSSSSSNAVAPIELPTFLTTGAFAALLALLA